jgi:hypothetical protein
MSGIGFRLSKEAMELIKEWGKWYFQYPKSNYIRFYGFDKSSFKLMRYFSNQMILMELSRQVVDLLAKF